MPSRHRFLADRSGNISLLFAAMLVPVCGVIGMSVDLGRSLQTKTQVQAALDAAALAGGRTFQVTGSVEDAEAAAVTHFREALPDGVPSADVTALVDEASYSIEVTVRTAVKTTFLRLLGQSSIDIAAVSRASLAVGGSDKDLEVALMLDVTGSMCDPCSKIDDLKIAAKDLIQIVVPDNQSEHVARVSVVPFSASVNPGSVRTAVRGPNTSSTACTGNSTSGWNKNQCYRDTHNRSQTVARTNCVIERTGSEAFTDAAPSGPASRVGTAYGATCPTSAVVPLTTDKEALKAAVDGLSTGGWTAGQIGTAWAWYTLSPEWSSIWPGSSTPAAYNTDDTYKIAVLMTDGEYNTEYASYVRAADQYGNPLPSNGRSDEQARRLCTEMKAKGITVYTVGFMLEDANAVETLAQCASSASHAFVASDGAELKEAFREIAFQLSKLRISR